MPALPVFRLEAYFARWEFTARYHLTAADAETMSLADLLALADEAGLAEWESLRLGYTSTVGLPALREAIAATYDRLSADDVVCFAGVAEPIYLAMQVLLDPGDHAVVLTPCYQAAETVPLSVCDVTAVPLRPEDGWALDVDAVARVLRPSTRVVMVNFPNNPTGVIPALADWIALVELCAERDIRLVSDEINRGIEVPPQAALPQAADLSPGALSLNGMAKAYGLPGLRIGWIASQDRELLGRLERAKHYTSICCPGPSEVLALIALRAREAILERNRQIVAENAGLFGEFFARFGDLFDWQPPMGGCVCFPRYLGADGVEAMCRDLVGQAGVLLLPASIFRSDLVRVPADRFRVGTGRRDPQEALAAWANWLDKRR